MNILKKIGIIALVVLAVLGATGICFGIVNSMQKLNPDNIIVAKNYDEELTADRVTAIASEDGTITVTGKNATEEDLKIKVCDVTLDKGEYTISSGAKGTGKNYNLCIETGEGDNLVTITADTKDDSTFKVDTDDTMYTVYIVVTAGAEIDTTFQPVLVSGDKVGSFYTFGN